MFDLNCQMASELVEDVMKDSSQKVEEEFDEGESFVGLPCVRTFVSIPVFACR